MHHSHSYVNSPQQLNRGQHTQYSSTTPHTTTPQQHTSFLSFLSLPYRTISTQAALAKSDRRDVAARTESECIGLLLDQEATSTLKEAGWGVALDMIYSRINGDEV
ncbi:hypothetical protein E2C01_091408 [Portunus trituberculatus]|uniref:Uncharacterized protein n=1 Tax=Portunus trituberculatus TaxID=210409 RepID=A0A5B7JPB0_PORTR|nr:hypothetical protein [Portunus trituberculatus]